ncbi:hypothetical protein [Streptomyces sp. NPDC088400]|uniref:hypothetical protein n=1 Tax=Streptomyces sp. NPDC088400 TaxID=3365861 RepID=UPI0038020BFF
MGETGQAPAPFLARRPLTGPLEMALGWIRALGTAAGSAMVGFLVHAKYPAAQADDDKVDKRDGHHLEYHAMVIHNRRIVAKVVGVAQYHHRTEDGKYTVPRKE